MYMLNLAVSFASVLILVIVVLAVTKSLDIYGGDLFWTTSEGVAISG